MAPVLHPDNPIHTELLFTQIAVPLGSLVFLIHVLISLTCTFRAFAHQGGGITQYPREEKTIPNVPSDDKEKQLAPYPSALKLFLK